MIKIRIKNADHEIDVRFPISETSCTQSWLRSTLLRKRTPRSQPS